MEFKASEIKAIGKQVSYKTKLGGIGLGYQLPKEAWKPGQELSIVWKSGGNGWYYPEEVTQTWDGDTVYLSAIRGLK